MADASIEADKLAKQLNKLMRQFEVLQDRTERANRSFQSMTALTGQTSQAMQRLEKSGKQKNEVLASLTKTLAPAKTTAWTKMQEGAKAGFEAIANIASSGWDAVGKKARTGIENIQNAAEQRFPAASRRAKEVIGAVKQPGPRLAAMKQGAISGLGSFVRNKAGEFKQKAPSFFKAGPAAAKMSGAMAQMEDMGLGIVGILGQLGGAGLGAASEVSGAFSTIRLKTGATEGQLNELMGSFKRVAATAPQSMGEIAESLSVLHKSTGATYGTLENLTKATLNAAQLTGGKSADIAAAAAGAMKAWGVGAEDGALLLDRFYAASKASGVGMDVLMKRFQESGGSLKQMGLGLDQSIALLAKWQDGDLQGLGDGLKKAFLDSNGVKGFGEKLKNAGYLFDATRMASDRFGASVGRDLAVALQGGRVEFKGAMAALQGSGGILDRQSKAAMGFGERWGEMKNRITLALAPVGEVLLKLGEAVFPVAQMFSSGLSYMMENANVFGPAIKAIAGVLFLLFVPSLLATAAATIAAMWPLLAIIAVVGLVGAAIGYLGSHWDEIVSGMEQAFMDLWSYIQAIPDKVKALFADFKGITIMGYTIGGPDEPETGAAAPKPAGSYYHGLDYVPYDGMIARLHKGERVMTASENKILSEGGGTARITITGNTFNVSQPSDIDAIARALAREIKIAGGLMA